MMREFVSLDRWASRADRELRLSRRGRTWRGLLCAPGVCVEAEGGREDVLSRLDSWATALMYGPVDEAIEARAREEMAR